MREKYRATALSLILTLAFLAVILFKPLPVSAQNTSKLISPFITINTSNQSFESWLSLSQSLTSQEEHNTFIEDAKSYVDLLVKSQINLKEELKEVEDYLKQSQKKIANAQNDEVYQLYQAIKEEIRQRLQNKIRLKLR